MGQKYLFKNISIVNEGKIVVTDIFTSGDRIERIDRNIGVKGRVIEYDGTGKYLFPGIIDDQVHFREPGLTHKATIYSESKAAVAGGVTSFMEMPNTIPNTLTGALLEEKYSMAAKNSLANYSFFMGASNDNFEEVLKMNKRKKDVCGIKIFMGSSTGNMLVDNKEALNKIFKDSELLIATHCEDEQIIKSNYAQLKSSKENLSPEDHPLIRNVEACYASSFSAVELAKKYNSRLHILHISTARELDLFSNALPLSQKRITAEVCVHHLHFSDEDYKTKGYLIKCNPSIKSADHRTALWQGLLDNKLDVIATDHAPHTIEEKKGPYEHAHSGMPLVQHSLLLMLDHYINGQLSLEKISEKMSHAVAECFKIKDRGYIREGYFADLVLVDLQQSTTVKQNNILYKCGWSPFENKIFPAAITHTFVNGNCIYSYENGNHKWNENQKGERISFSE